MHTNNVNLRYGFFNELTVDRPFERTDNVIMKQMDWPQFIFRRDLLSWRRVGKILPAGRMGEKGTAREDALSNEICSS